MQVGEAIKIFPDTDIHAYKQLIHSKGFCCVRKGNKLIIKAGKETLVDKEATARSITQFRRKMNMKREDMAKALGVRKDTVWDWEIGLKIPKQSNQEKLKEIGWEGVVYKVVKNED